MSYKTYGFFSCFNKKLFQLKYHGVSGGWPKCPEMKLLIKQNIMKRIGKFILERQFLQCHKSPKDLNPMVVFVWATAGETE